MQDIEDFDYLSSIKDNALLIYREIRKIIYKTILNKTLKYTNYTNRIMRKFVDNALK